MEAPEDDKSYSSSDEDESSEETRSYSSSDPSSSQNVHNKNDAEKVSLSHDETKAVNRSKILVYIALVVCAVVTGTTTYYVAHMAEVQNFEDAVRKHVFACAQRCLPDNRFVSPKWPLPPQFEDYALDVSAVAENNAEDVFGAARALGTSLTSHALQLDKLTTFSWPNLTLPDFGKRFDIARNFTGVAFLMYTPLVTNEMLDKWHTYAEENQGWIREELSYIDPTIDPGPIAPIVYSRGEDGIFTDTNVSNHYPMWQVAPLPINASIINLDTLPLPTYNFSQVINDAVKERRALLSGVVNMTRLFSFLNSDMYGASGEDPHSVIFEPVYNNFTEQASIVAFVQAGFPWQYTFTDILPTGTLKKLQICVRASLAQLLLPLCEQALLD